MEESRTTSKKRRSSSMLDMTRGGPEGESMYLKQNTAPQVQSPKNHKAVGSPSKIKKSDRPPGKGSLSSSYSTPSPKREKFTSSSKKKKPKPKDRSLEVTSQVEEEYANPRKNRPNVSDSAADASNLTDSRLSVQSHSKAKKKKASTDVIWEKAVEKARGLPDGALGGEDDDEEEREEEYEDDEIDVDAPPPPKKLTTKASSSKKNQFEKGKKKPLNVLQTAAKKLKKIGHNHDNDDNNVKVKGKKRKLNEEETNAEKKKAKVEELGKKEKKKQRKMQKSNFDIATQAKSLWEQLRRFDLPPEKRHQLSSDLLSLVAGRAKELIFAHDTSRVIQCLMKYGSQEHKNALFEELREHLIEMTKSKYAKFFVRKLLKYGTRAQRNYVFRKLYGNIRKLIRHKEAAEIVECAYNDYANAGQRSSMIEEFYGPSFALFKTPESKTLDVIMQSQPGKRESILSNMKESLSALVEKTVLQYSIVHRVFLEFFTFASNKMRTEMIETLREGIIHMLHTRDGARVAMACLWYGTAKDRKVIVKSFKTFVVKICMEEYGHLVLLSVFDVVDDTKLVEKAILEELLKRSKDVTQDQYGRKVLLYLLSPRDPVHFHPDVVKILEQGDSNPHSKKDKDLRRNELLEFISRPLVQCIVDNCKELVMNNASLLLITAAIAHVKGDPTEAMRAVALIAAEPFVAGSLENLHIVEHPAGHLILKRLILSDIPRIKNGEKVLFSGILLDILPEGSLKSWAACNRGCFILISLMELNHPELSGKVKDELAAVKASLKKMDFKGAQTLLSKLKA